MSEQTNDAQRDDDSRLNEIGVIKRREIEARILKPMLEAMAEEFGDAERVRRVAARTIIRIAREQGDKLAQAMGGRSLTHFRESLKYWRQDGALEIDVLEQDEETFSFNVTRCRYAEMYRALGMPELGATLSCNRDFALIEGFDPDTKLTRTQTIMQGAPFCDFRYRKRGPETLPD
jgi:hypothetical protein